jgi:hypothetical protein
MVGPPKTLYDLRKVEGVVRITCRSCKRRYLLDREQVILMRMVALKTCDWATFVHETSCRECSSSDVRVQIEAFGDGLPELKRRRSAMITIELALIILKDASYSGSRKAIPVEAVRLALRALHPHLQDKATLEGFWVRYADPNPAIHENPVGYYDEMIRALLKRGYPVPAELRHGV